MQLRLRSGVTVAWHRKGQGPLLLLLAGTGYAAATWPPRFLDELSDGFTVVTMDYRGTGRTPGTEGDYSTRLFAADAIGLLEAIGAGSAHVLGHSMGGRVAQWVALDGPSWVRSLVLAASGPGAWTEPGPLPIPIKTVVELAEHGYEGYIRRQIGRTFFTPEFAEREPGVVEWLVRTFWASRPTLPEYLKHVVARQQHNTVRHLSDMGHPTLVLVGDRDTHLGGTGSHVEQSEYLARHLPRARLEIMPDAAHGYFWQYPEQSAAVVSEFLLSVSPNT